MQGKLTPSRGYGFNLLDAPELRPDSVLPVQFLARSGSEDVPEKRLMLVVLESAISDFQKHATAQDRRGRRYFLRTVEWLASDDGEWPFSFVNICHALNLDAGYLRSGLWRWHDRQLRHDAGTALRFPFRRLPGTRHVISGQAQHLGQSA